MDPGRTTISACPHTCPPRDVLLSARMQARWDLAWVHAALPYPQVPAEALHPSRAATPHVQLRASRSQQAGGGARGPVIALPPFNAISVADKTAPIGFGPSTYPIGALVLSIQMIDIIKGAWRLPSITSSSWIISLINGNILFSLWRRWILIMISFHSFFVLKKDEKLVKPDL
ncbi:hypothetical protein GGX14DRAFT_397992 [Mycena pura]|uniref:Uncharacterized protein n=1 Tax=Mycena pura TaxID=153505 RepID=A0AAD6V7F7_9AGAR|nr:hypothetical protein GGX14DRAFT_397992 [Mycena pura]